MTGPRKWGRRCPSCNSSGSPGESFCRVCGALATGSLECEHHPGTPAETACVVCGMPLCRSCGGQHPALCADPEHASIVERWVRVFATNSEFEADCLTQNLKDRAVASRAFSSRSFTGLCPTSASDAVSVFVKKEDLETAEACLAELTGPLGDEADTTVEGI